MYNKDWLWQVYRRSADGLQSRWVAKARSSSNMLLNELNRLACVVNQTMRETAPNQALKLNLQEPARPKLIVSATHLSGRINLPTLAASSQ